MTRAVVDVKVEKDEGWYIISIPSIPGAFSQAKTAEEVVENAFEVISMMFDFDKEPITNFTVNFEWPEEEFE